MILSLKFIKTGGDKIMKEKIMVMTDRGVIDENEKRCEDYGNYVTSFQ